MEKILKLEDNDDITAIRSRIDLMFPPLAPNQTVEKDDKRRLLLIVPCHRVVASNGLGGYGGNLDAKVWLLDIEEAPLPSELHKIGMYEEEGRRIL